MITFEIVENGQMKQDKEAISVYKAGRFVYVREESLEIKVRGRKQIAGAKSFIESLRYTGITNERIDRVTEEIELLAKEVSVLEEEKMKKMFAELEHIVREKGFIGIFYIKKGGEDLGDRWVTQQIEEQSIAVKTIKEESQKKIIQDSLGTNSNQELDIYLQEIQPGIFSKYCDMQTKTLDSLREVRKEKYRIDLRMETRKSTSVYMAGEENRLTVGQKDGELCYMFGSYIEKIKEEENEYVQALSRLYEKVKKAGRLKELYEKDFHFFKKFVNIESRAKTRMQDVFLQHMDYSELEDYSAKMYYEEGTLDTFQGGGLTGKFFEFGEWFGYISWENQDIVMDKTVEGLNQKIAKLRENEIGDVFKKRKEQMEKKETKESNEMKGKLGHLVNKENYDRLIQRMGGRYSR